MTEMPDAIEMTEFRWGVQALKGIPSTQRLGRENPKWHTLYAKAEPRKP